MISKKQLIEIAGNKDVMELLKEIAEIKRYEIWRTEYERASDKKKINKLAVEIQNTLYPV